MWGIAFGLVAFTSIVFVAVCWLGPVLGIVATVVLLGALGMLS